MYSLPTARRYVNPSSRHTPSFVCLHGYIQHTFELYLRVLHIVNIRIFDITIGLYCFGHLIIWSGSWSCVVVPQRGPEEAATSALPHSLWVQHSLRSLAVAACSRVSSCLNLCVLDISVVLQILSVHFPLVLVLGPSTSVVVMLRTLSGHFGACQGMELDALRAALPFCHTTDLLRCSRFSVLRNHVL